MLYIIQLLHGLPRPSVASREHRPLLGVAFLPLGHRAGDGGLPMWTPELLLSPDYT
jgi:hypothetical protein